MVFIKSTGLAIMVGASLVSALPAGVPVVPVAADSKTAENGACLKYSTPVVAGDTCYGIGQKPENNVGFKQLELWNTGVDGGVSCKSLQIGSALCLNRKTWATKYEDEDKEGNHRVAQPGTEISGWAPEPSACGLWAKTYATGDRCDKFFERNGLKDFAAFAALNSRFVEQREREFPNGEECNNIWPSWWYCVKAAEETAQALLSM